MLSRQWRGLYRQNAGAFLDWPEDLQIIDYEEEDLTGERIIVKFRKVPNEDRI